MSWATSWSSSRVHCARRWTRRSGLGRVANLRLRKRIDSKSRCQIAYSFHTMNSFVALDVETANPDYSSICAIGLCRFDSGLVVDEWHRLIDPGEPFEARNIAIHGIRPEHVIGQPSYSELAEDLDRFVRGSMVVHHGHFDRNAIKQTSQRWALPAPVWDFLDSAQAARQAWPQLVRGGYGLSDLCKEIGHELEHHHATRWMMLAPRGRCTWRRQSGWAKIRCRRSLVGLMTPRAIKVLFGPTLTNFSWVRWWSSHARRHYGLFARTWRRP